MHPSTFHPKPRSPAHVLHTFTLHPTQYTLQLFTLNPEITSICCKLYALHPTRCTRQLPTIHPAPCIVNLIFWISTGCGHDM